jgi:PTS system mannose-specific IIA component
MGISNRAGGERPVQQQIFGLLVTHHNIGLELIRAAASIVGPQEDLGVLSNQDASFDSLCQKIQSLIPPDRDAIIMVDYFGGSAYLAARTICKSADRRVFISGVNLPMVLSFVTKRNQLRFPELVEVIKADAVRGIR